MELLGKTSPYRNKHIVSSFHRFFKANGKFALLTKLEGRDLSLGLSGFTEEGRGLGLLKNLKSKCDLCLSEKD